MIPCPNCNNAFDPVGKWGIKKFCSRKCANKRTHTEETKRKISLSSVGRQVSDEIKQKISAKLRGRNNYWNLGRAVSDTTRKKISESHKGKPKSEAHKQKMSDLAVKRGFGGHTSKRKIWYTRKDGTITFLQSSYEVKFATLLDEMNIEWCRPDPLVWVDTAGIRHRYYPDFQVGELFFDTKNDYLIKKDAEKIRAVTEQNDVVIHVVSLDMITEDYIASVV